MSSNKNHIEECPVCKAKFEQIIVLIKEMMWYMTEIAKHADQTTGKE